MVRTGGESSRSKKEIHLAISAAHTLLTGATGLIGRQWLPMLLSADSNRLVTIVTRDVARVPTDPRIKPLVGDLSAPQLGLTNAEWEALGASISEIIHCAANIQFNLPLDQARRVNTDGTSALLDLARTSKNLRRFAHVSTAYIQGRDDGSLPEAQFKISRGFFNTYQQSKYEAENLVFAAMHDIPAAIFRLSSVIGHSGTGRVSQINYFHKILRMIPRYPFPIIPAVPHYRLDLIPDDWAASSLSELYEHHFQPGAVFNICAGPRRSVPVGTLIESAFECFGCKRRPTMVSLDEFEIYARSLVKNGARDVVKALLTAFSYFLPHLAIDQRFENQKSSELLTQAGICFPDDSFFRRVLGYCAESSSW